MQARNNTGTKAGAGWGWEEVVGLAYVTDHLDAMGEREESRVAGTKAVCNVSRWKMALPLLMMGRTTHEELGEDWELKCDG